MNDLLKKPYKISLWEDKNVYVIQWVYDSEGKPIEGAIEEVEVLPTLVATDKRGYKVLNQYFKEIRILDIGSNTMDTPIRAFNPTLKQELNGSNTFTFNMFYKYWDDETQEYKDNPFINLVVNERKLKLFYDDEWYDFVVKQAQESTDQKQVQYTCTDMYINELSKNGFNIELKTDLENNQGTITQLATSILENTDWRVDTSNSDTIKQTTEEPLYTYIIKSDLTATVMDDFDKYDRTYTKGETVTIASGSTIYIFYSSVANEEDKVQFFWLNGLTPVIDDDGFILNSPNIQAPPEDVFRISGESFDWSKISSYNLVVSTVYRGEKLVQQQISKYFASIGKYCSLWSKNGTKYWSYIKTEANSPDNIKDLIQNGSDFTSTDGWGAYIDGDKYSTISLGTYVDSNQKCHNTITANMGTAGKITNDGFYSNRVYTNGLVADESYIFAIKTLESNTSLLPPSLVFEKAGSPTVTISFTDITGNTIIPDTLSGYKVYRATITSAQAMSYNTMILYTPTFFVNAQTGSIINILDAKLFKQLTQTVSGVTKLIVPNLETTINSVVTVYYKFFTATQLETTNLTSIDDLIICNTFTSDELSTCGYTPLYELDGEYEAFEKIRSIEGSESNCFNLIQTLCETFECWAKFTVGHNSDTGAITYQYVITSDSSYIKGKQYYIYKPTVFGSKTDKDYQYANITKFEEGIQYYERQYDKTVCFKEFIGQENDAGFRYGINLKSIQRTLDSNTIVSKLIVKPNSNEYADGGMCTIQTATNNPTNETEIYNFDYYVKNGLLDATDLNHDLYGPSTLGINLYARLKALNKENNSLIEEEVLLNDTIDNLTASVQQASAQKEEANTNYLEQVNELETQVSGYNSSWVADSSHNDTVNQMLRNRDYLKDQYDLWSTTYTTNNTLLTEYTTKLNTAVSRLEEIETESANILKEFYKKYSRFIQEGSWISEDYIDPNLYYLDACSVLYSSAYPKVTYNISVLELSQLDGYEPYKFKIGDKTYMEDVEYFGYTTTGKPYQEEIIVSQVQYNLDDPSLNTITVQNYKTQFEDLFQRIAATTQSLQYTTGSYNRAAETVNEDNTINVTTLQNSLQNNSLIISNARDQSVTWDSSGLLVTSLTSPNQIVKLVSGGIMLSTDGGRTWITGITGSGINANSIAAGTIDTNSITISNSAWSAFRWDANGLSAYSFDIDTKMDYNYNKFVRLDQYGLYGYSGSGNTAWVPGNDEDYDDPEEEIIAKARFSLTWNGFHIKTDSGAVSISSDEDIQVLDLLGHERVHIGQLDTSRYGIELFNANQERTLFTDDAGALKLANSISVAKDGETARVQLGYLSAYKGNDATNHQVINANNNFIVYEDGSIYAGEAEFDGSGSFHGLVYADGGYFSGPITIAKKINDAYETSTTQLGYIPYYDPQVGITQFDTSKTYYEFNSDGTYSVVDQSKGFNPNKTYYLYRPKLIDANNNFIVFNDGSIVAKNGEFTGIINATEAHFTNGFSIGNNFTVDAEGNMTATNGSFGGVVNATNGSFNGNISATGLITVGDGEDKIYIEGRSHDDDNNPLPTGIYSGTWVHNDDGTWTTTDDIGFYIATDGQIIAKGLDIDGQASIGDRIQIGDNCYISNPTKYNKEFISVYNGAHANVLIDSDGVITVGPADNQICIDGGRGMIASANYATGGLLGWQIDNSQAIFNNIVARGSIKSSVFEYGEVQAVGGILVIRPSSVIKSIIKEDSVYNITLENATGFSEGDYCKIQIGSDFTEAIICKITSKTGAVLQCTLGRDWPSTSSYEDAIGQPFISYGTMGDVGIAINSSDNDSFVPAKSITVFESLMGESEGALVDGINPHIIIGVIPNNYIYNRTGSQSDTPTYGLYAENAMIKGAIIAEDIAAPDRYVTGIDTNSAAKMPNPDNKYFPSSEVGRIVLWGGAEGSDVESIQNAPFKVDTYGNVYAGSGYFEGTIISNASISAAEIRTATLTGWDVTKNESDKRAALTIRDCQKGIKYVKNGTYFDDTLTGRAAVYNPTTEEYEETTIMELTEANLQLYNDLKVNDTFTVSGNNGLMTAATSWYHQTYDSLKPTTNVNSMVLTKDGIQFSTTKTNDFTDSLNNMANIYYSYSFDSDANVIEGGLKIDIQSIPATYYEKEKITNYLRTLIDNNFSLGDIVNYVQVKSGQNDTLIGYDIYVEQ